MAIIKCDECGQNVSTKAKTCPHCGFEVSEMQYFEKNFSNDSSFENSTESCCDAQKSQEEKEIKINNSNIGSETHKCKLCEKEALEEKLYCSECLEKILSKSGKEGFMVVDKESKIICLIVASLLLFSVILSFLPIFCFSSAFGISESYGLISRDFLSMFDSNDNMMLGLGLCTIAILYLFSILFIVGPMLKKYILMKIAAFIPSAIVSLVSGVLVPILESYLNSMFEETTWGITTVSITDLGTGFIIINVLTAILSVGYMIYSKTK